MSEAILAGISSQIAGINGKISNLQSKTNQAQDQVSSTGDKVPSGNKPKNWSDLIKATNEYFKNNSMDENFGNWGSVINELNAFHDGNASERKGQVISKLHKFLHDGLTNEKAIENTAHWYAEKWGNDKVIENRNLII